MTDLSAIGSIFGLAGKTALITGAATGIGRDIARLFHQAGADVFGADLNEAALATLPDECPGARTIALDQSDPASIRAMFDTVDAAGASLDILVNCAAIYSFKPFEEVDPAFLDRMLAVNLRGPFICSQQAVRRMKSDNRGGSIVNIASVLAVRAGTFDNVHYGVTKAALNNMTVLLAAEYGEHNIRVNSVLPGGVGTEQAGKAAGTYPLRGPFTQPGRVPLNPQVVCGPEQIAQATLYLASDASSFVTGQLLAVDGGFLIS